MKTKKQQSTHRGFRGRNWLAVSAFLDRPSAGPHARSRNEPRGGCRNLQQEFLYEYLDDYSEPQDEEAPSSEDDDPANQDGIIQVFGDNERK
jgi:hypothetical protein